MNEKKEKQKMQYSKLLPVFTGIVFVCCLFRAFTVDFSNYVDLTVYATSITVSGGIWGTTVVGYMKKAQVENNVKLKIELYRVAFQEQLKYKEQMLIIKNKYLLSEEEFMDMEDDSPIMDLEGTIFSSIEETINVSQSDAESAIEIQNY